MSREKAQSAASPAATLVGLGAILLWSVLALLTASAGAIPPFELAALTFAIGGGLGLVYAAEAAADGEGQRRQFERRNRAGRSGQQR